MEEKRFDDIPDILDPDFSGHLSRIADRVFGGESWYISLYVADDGTGNVSIVSKSSHYGSSYSDHEIEQAYDGTEYSEEEVAEETFRWKKEVHWRWDSRYPTVTTSFSTHNDEDSFKIDSRVLFEFDMSEWKDKMIFGNIKRTNTTAQYEDNNGESKTDFGWDSGRFRHQSSELTNMSEEDREADSLRTDEISEQFKKVYEMWMNQLRKRITESGRDNVPEPFDNRKRTDVSLPDMIQTFDNLMVKIEEHRAADSANVDSYASDFSMLRESFMHIDRNLVPQSTYRNDKFEENWNKFTKDMNLFIRLIEDHSSRL